MKPDIKIVALTKERLQYVLAAYPPQKDVSLDEMITAYLSKGSAAYCYLVDDEPVVVCGIVNGGWQRGAAWIFCTPMFKKHLKVCYRAMKEMFPGVCRAYKFRRVQAVSFNGGSPLFKHLGFTREAELECYGPEGQPGHIFRRIFQ